MAPPTSLNSIAIIGLWHQGVVNAACLADLGNRVVGFVEQQQEAADLNACKPAVYEPKLQVIMRRNRAAGRLRFTTDLADALQETDFVYIAFDTPVGDDDEPDLTCIWRAAEQIRDTLEKPVTVVVTAQVPVGTCDKILDILRQGKAGSQMRLAYVPEFLRLGTAVETFRKADRFVVGSDDPETVERVTAIYQPLGRPIIKTDVRTAEMAKHASNTFLATSISFINEIADLCDELGADANGVAQIMKLDRRVGSYAFLSPGLGFAGGTLGRDIRTIQKLGFATGCKTALMDAVLSVNQSRAALVSKRLRRLCGDLKGLSVCVFGLTYKAGTSTLRRSIALEIIRELVSQGAEIRAYDPLANLGEVADLPPLKRLTDPYVAAQGADAVVLITEWKGIKELDLARLKSEMRQAVFIDTRNFFEPGLMAKQGFVYTGIGRGMQIKGARCEARR